MSAPAGWHLQPDGRERFWDGTQWTEQFRAVAAPSANDPTAPASEPTASTPAWDRTQALDVSSTQAIPTQQQPYPDQGGPGPADPYSSQPGGYGAQPGGYGAQPGGYGAQPGGYGAPPSGYGAPGAPAGWQPPQRSGNGWLKGCLIALAVVVVLGIAAVVAAVVFFGRAVDQVSQGVASSFPSGLPTSLPSNLPTDLPTEGIGQQVDITVGRGFELPRATVEDGWSLKKQGAGALSVVTIDGMRATVQDANGVPVLFTISFTPSGGGDPVQTVCTAPSASAGATVGVSCVPLLGNVADARRGTVTTTL